MFARQVESAQYVWCDVYLDVEQSLLCCKYGRIIQIGKMNRVKNRPYQRNQQNPSSLSLETLSLETLNVPSESSFCILGQVFAPPYLLFRLFV